MNKYKAIKVHGKKIDEHRHIMQLHLGRKLSFNECVHHKDGNKSNNSLDNLEIKDRSKHAYDHQMNGDMHRVDFSKANGDKGRATQKMIYGKRVVVCDKDFNPIIILPSILMAARVTRMYYNLVYYAVTHNTRTKKPFQYVFASKLGL